MPRAHLVNKNFTVDSQIEELTWLYIDEFDAVTDPNTALKLIKEFTEDWHTIRYDRNVTK